MPFRIPSFIPTAIKSITTPKALPQVSRLEDAATGAASLVNPLSGQNKKALVRQGQNHQARVHATWNNRAAAATALAMEAAGGGSSVEEGDKSDGNSHGTSEGHGSSETKLGKVAKYSAVAASASATAGLVAVVTGAAEVPTVALAGLGVASVTFGTLLEVAGAGLTGASIIARKVDDARSNKVRTDNGGDGPVSNALRDAGMMPIDRQEHPTLASVRDNGLMDAFKKKDSDAPDASAENKTAAATGKSEPARPATGSGGNWPAASTLLTSRTATPFRDTGAASAPRPAATAAQVALNSAAMKSPETPPRIPAG